MKARFLTSMSALAALFGAQQVAAQALPDEIDVENAAQACGMEDALTVDAREIPVPGELASMIGKAGAQAIAIAGGSFNGEDFAPFAEVLSGACFYRTQLSNTNWRGADMSGSRFVAVDLQGADLSGAQLDGVAFTGVNLADAKLAKASLAGGEWIGEFWSSNLVGTSFAGANMRGFAFRCTILMYQSCGNGEGTDFSGVDFSGAYLHTLGIWGNDRFTGARFDATWIDPQAIAHIDDASVTGTILLPTRFDDDGLPTHPVTLSAVEFATLRSELGKLDDSQPSFDCAKAGRPAEKVICGEWQFELRALDRMMAQVFGEARRAGRADSTEQRAWLKRRDACADAECIEASYRERLDALFAALGDRWMLAPDETRTFHHDLLPVPGAFRGSELYRRMIPALAATSFQHVSLMGLEDGSVSAVGSALGANAHMCSLDVAEARFDPTNGWYSATTADGTRVPLFRLWGDRLVVRYSGNFGDTPEEAIDYISCGARAGFMDMIDLDGR